MALDCIDAFKTGNCGCGTIAGDRRVDVRDSKGGCTPVLHDPHRLVVHSCKKGPDKTVGAPQYELVIENPPDLILRDTDGKPILVDGRVVRA